MEDHINVRNINFDNSDEVKKVALIHEEMPKLWNPEYNLSPAELDERIELIKTHGNNDDFIYLVGLSDDGEIVAIEWGEVKEIHNEKAVYISSIWVDDNFRGTRVVKLLNAKLENWAKTRGANFISIDVHYNNERMIKLAQLFGYKPRFVELIKEF